jgi:hypothetical protein
LLITFDEFINILFVGAIHSDGRAKRKTHCIYIVFTAIPYTNHDDMIKNLLFV